MPSTETLYAINDALTNLMNELGLADSLGLDSEGQDDALQDATMAVAACWWPDEDAPAITPACIEVVEHGNTLTVSVATFLRSIIQSDEIGVEIVEDMLAGDGTYEFTDEYPQEFTILDRDLAQAQLTQILGD